MTIHALLIAISEYPDGVSNLPGCANDLIAFEAFFQEYAALNKVRFNPKILLNEDANRDQVLQSFSHFEQAGPEDVCLLYYTGHGSQLPAPPEFWHQETDRKCEALVLHDYGKPGGGYLADKEISYLLATHSKQAGQVLVIADSCHSGTISRMATAVPRTTAFNGLPLAIENFHGWENYRKEETFLSPPVREHITLAACRPEQVAMEMPIKNVRRGLFTHYLLEVMRTNDLSSISYAELADRVRVRVKNHYRKQDVFAETTPGSSLNVPFLGGELKRSHNLLLHYGKGIGWYFEQGEIAGVKPENTGSALAGEAEQTFTVKRVDAGRAFVEAAPWMAAAEAPYPIVDIDKKGTPLAIYVDRSKMSSVVGGALSERIREEKDTLLLVEKPEEAKYHVVYTPTYGIHLVLPGEERPLFEGTKGQANGWAVKFADQLSRVSSYEATLSMAPTNRVLEVDKVLEVQLEQVYINDFEEVVEVEAKATDGTAVFPYYQDEFTNSVEPPLVRLKVKVKNDYAGVLYVGMLFLDESFGISGEAMVVNALKAGDGFYQTKVIRPADPDDPDSEDYPQSFFSLLLSDTLQSWGLTEITNYLKIIVSETPIELTGYDQDSLTQQEKLPDGRGMRAMAPAAPRRARRRDRWGVKNIPITIYRPLYADTLTAYDGTEGEAPISVATQPAGFQFEGMLLDASLSTTRSLSSTSAPPCPTQGFHLEPISLMGSRSMLANETPLDMVQLMNVSNAEAVTADTPLELRAGSAAADGCIMFGFDEDTQRYYPVGFPDAEKNVMVVQQLPQASPEEYTRSLGGSIKLFFRKVVGKYVPWLDEEVNKLRVAEVNEELEVAYTEDAPARVAQAVKDTDKPIALFIHGIIGDTTTAAAILRRAKYPDGTSLYDRYGLLLTYDYENLNTSILKTSRLFKQDLADAGFKEGHGKTLHIYAHSMGGLVTRGFIELYGGNKIVTAHLQFGTPNGGSPYGNVAQWITPLISRALEAGAAYHPYLRPLLALRWFVNKVLVTLQEMKIGSEVFKTLADGDRGDVPYYLVNGDIGLIPDVTPEDLSFFQRILERLDWQEAAQKIFFQAPTDVAVSVESQQKVPGLAFYPKAVGSDHMSYFITPAAITVLEAYLNNLFTEQ